MKRSSSDGVHVYNFGIPAFRSKSGLATCPMAGRCASGCYAMSGTYRFSNVAKAYETRLELTQSPNFQSIIMAELSKLTLKHKTGQILIRVHDSGDFYTKDYQQAWYKIAALNPRIQFYAYTKMISQSRSLESLKPSNFRLIYSQGGKEDALINADTDMHAKVFESLESLVKSRYVDGTESDLVAALGSSNKIGLVYHGAKSFKNTKWEKTNE